METCLLSGGKVGHIILISFIWLLLLPLPRLYSDMHDNASNGDSSWFRLMAFLYRVSWIVFYGIVTC